MILLRFHWRASFLALAAILAGCGDRGSTSGKPRVGVSFETLQTEYWVASLDAIKAELAKQNAEILEAVADGDSNRQLEQIKSFAAQGVDGIIVVPKDANAAVPMVKAANSANIPIVLYNRPPAENAGTCAAVVADNEAITFDTVDYLATLARKSGTAKHQAMILIGDLADANALGRRAGFDRAVKKHADILEVVAEVPTEWNQEKALAGAVNALRSHPEIDFIFTSSDFLLPSLVSALKDAGKYQPAGQPGHVFLAGFDGDATAFRLLQEGYLDADGVQDVAFECRAAVQAVFDMKAGKKVDRIIRDPGFVIHRDNLADSKSRMWGANISHK